MMKSRPWLMKRENLVGGGQETGLNLEILPRTILDSMDFVSRIGERYLWVDALCIAQDDRLEL